MHVRTPSVGTLGGLQTAPVVVKGPRREWRKPKPMMNGLKKSDEAIWTLLTKVETSCDRILIAGGANVEAEWEQGPAV